MSPDVLSALQGVRFIAQQIKNTDKDNEVSESVDFFLFFFFFSNCDDCL